MKKDSPWTLMFARKENLANLGREFVAEGSARARGLRAVVFLLVAVALLVFPLRTKTRPLVSPKVSKELSLSTVKPGPPLFGGAQHTYQLVVDMDVAVAEGRLSLERLRSVDPLDFVRSHRRGFEAYPYRYSTVLAIPFGTFGRVNECELTLSLNGNITSKPLSCEDLEDNGLARFRFSAPIPPGIYSATLTSAARNPSHAVAPYVAEDASGSQWLVPHSSPSYVASLDFFRSLYTSEPRIATASLFGVLLLGGLFVWAVGNAATFLSTFLLLAGVVSLLTKPMSGHDETAHLTMLYHAIVESEGLQGASVYQPAEEFYKSAAAYMLDSDFYRLHSSKPLQPGKCPHEILGGCGTSAGPMQVYKVYAAVARFAGVTLESPASLVAFGRVINLLLSGLVAALIWVLYQGPTLAVVSAVMVMTGGYLSGMASITNDVPAFLLGFFALATGLYAANGGGFWRSAVGYGILCLSYAVLFPTDPSFIAAIPLVGILLVPVLFGTRWANSSGIGPKGDGTRKLFGIFLAAFLGVLWGANSLLPWLASSDPSGIFPTLLATFPRSDTILAYSNVSAAHMFHATVAYFKSLFGSFVWGHSYYHAWVYAAFFVGYALLAVRGVMALSRRMSRRYCYAWVGALGCLFAVQVAVIASIAAPYAGADAVTFDSYTKVRLTAPALATVWLLPAFGLVDMLRQPVMRRTVLLALILWSLVIALYYLPVFYFADLF